MSASRQRWLLEQIPDWEREGLLTPEAAVRLRERYAEAARRPGLGQILLGALGALLIGSGLIAVLAHNWDDFSRPVRLLCAFLPLLVTQIFSWYALRRDVATWVRETAGLLQALAAGACIALVSQIYHLGGDWPDFLRAWFLLALPLAWVLRSDAVSLFYLVAITVWTLNRSELEVTWQDSAMLFPLLLLALLPRWWRQPAPGTVLRWLLACAAALGLASAAITALEHGEGISRRGHAVPLLWSLLAAGFVLLPLNARGLGESLARKPQIILGGLWLFGFGLAATFRSLGLELLKGLPVLLSLPVGWLGFTLLAGFMVLAVRQQRWAVLAVASVVLLPLLVHAFSPDTPRGTLLAGFFTLHLALVGLTLILLDFAGRPSAPRLGAAVLSLLVITRMADSDLSLLTKGLAFILVGSAFLAFNFFMSRRRREGIA
jgi:hypothetical protein